MEYNQKPINSLQAGDAFEGFVLIKSIAVRTGSNGKNYVDLTVADEDASINGKIWDYNEALDELKVNMLIKVRGSITSWQNMLQLRIDKVRPATADDPVKIDDLVPSAPESGEQMLEDIYIYLGTIQNKDLKAITEYILNKYRDKLLYYPAAQSNHHALKGGLLYHTLTMLRAGDALCRVYTDLDTDWVFAGVILHDMEKINELASNELGLVNDYTRDGLLLGHLVQGAVSIAEAGRAVGANDEVVVLLQHMITAHHYEPEFGSPRRPMFPEAELLHYLDIIDARMFDFRKALESVEEGGFSDKQWLLNNRRLYKRHKDI